MRAIKDSRTVSGAMLPSKTKKVGKNNKPGEKKKNVGKNIHNPHPVLVCHFFSKRAPRD
jgi:hypothetical protein